MGGNQDESKQLANTAMANLLDQFLRSITDSLDKASEIEAELNLSDDKLEFRKTFVAAQLPKLQQLASVVAGHPKTREDLRHRINQVTEDLRDPYFDEDLYQAHYTQMLKALTSAFIGNFGIKEDVQIKALLTVITKISPLRETVLIPESYRRYMQDREELDDD